MNKFIFILVLLLGGVHHLSQAQMTAARRVPPALSKSVELSAPAEKVWEYVSQPANHKKFADLKVFECEERALNAKIRLETKRGNKREQHISFLDFDNYRICYFVTKSDYDSGCQWVYDFVVKAKDKKNCLLVLNVYYGGDTLPEHFAQGIEHEFNDIITGVSKKFN